MKKFQIMLAVLLVFGAVFAGTAMAAENNFADVSADAWYADAVAYVQEQGLMNGNTPTEFSPDESLTRAMLATVLWRQAESPVVNYLLQFSDVADGQWYTEAIRWAASEQLVNGYGDGLFGPNDTITQEQLGLIFGRYTEQNVTENIPGFSGEAVPVSRAQVAAALMNLAALNQEATAESTENNNAEQPAEETPAEGKILVAYFSASGNTKAVAEYIAAAVQADLYEITPETPYSSADLDWTNSASRVSVEHAGGDSGRPAISGGVEDMAQYDVVFVGYPIWWGEAPNIVRTFLESYDFSGKTLVPFCTSSSSGLGSSAENLHSLAAGANWLTGERFRSGADENTVTNWANGLNIGK